MNTSRRAQLDRTNDTLTYSITQTKTATTGDEGRVSVAAAAPDCPGQRRIFSTAGRAQDVASQSHERWRSSVAGLSRARLEAVRLENGVSLDVVAKRGNARAEVLRDTVGQEGPAAAVRAVGERALRVAPRHLDRLRLAQALLGRWWCVVRGAWWRQQQWWWW